MRKPLRASQSLFLVPANPVRYPVTLITRKKFEFAERAYIYAGSYRWKPMIFEGKLWATAGTSNDALVPAPSYADETEAYLLVESRWPGAATSLSEKWLRMGMKGSLHDDPLGGYHGIAIDKYVMVGPPRIFLCGQAEGWCESMRRHGREFDPTKDDPYNA